MKNLPRAVNKLALIPISLLVLVSTAFAPAPADPPAITEFRFEVQYNQGKITENIIADIYGDTLIVGIIPFQQSQFNLTATFVATSATVRINDVDQQSTVTMNDFSSPVNYVVADGEVSKTYKVKLVYTGLPLVYVYTDGGAPVISKDDYVDGTITIYPNNHDEDVYSGVTEIRGRGNTTWTLDKKPYKIKLDSKASILGMPSDKEWVLLANHADKTLMRNSLAFYLGSHMNLAYTPRTTHVDLVLNGVYQGNYLLGEHIKVDNDRVDIKELEPEDIEEDKITGGYFLELDTYRDGVFFELAGGLPFVMKSPDEPAQEQYDYIKGYMQQTEDAIMSDEFADPDEGYVKFINPGSFIEWYWVNEVVKNIDAQDVSSIFYFKERDEKLNMGPLWDFDVAAGNASLNTGDDPLGFFVRESKWFKRLFEDSVFRRTAEARWDTLRDELLSALPQVIDSFANKLQLSQRQNFYKWDVLSKPIFPNEQALGSYQNEVDYLKDWMTTRIQWIDDQINPFVDVIGVPVLYSPAMDTMVEDLSPALMWYAAHLADTYDLQVSSTTGFDDLIVDRSALADTIYSITEQLSEQTTYYWRARAVNTDGPGDWSEVRSFTTPTISGVGEATYGVSMFPNPTTKELYIHVPSSSLVEHAALVDAFGRTATSSEILPGVITKIDVSGLQRGMYILILRGKMDKPLANKIILR